MENVKYKICYWYHEYQDMSASVPTCDYYRQYGKCPCEPECEHFITKKEVDDIVRNMGKIGQMNDLISRQDALNPFCVAPDGRRIPEVDCDNFPVEFSVEFIKKHLLSLPSIEPRGDLISREDAMVAVQDHFNADGFRGYDDGQKMMDRIKALPSAEYSKPLQTTLNSDLISRADAIDAIQNAYCKPCKERGDDHNEVRCRVCEYDNAIIQIDALPSADAVKGEWLQREIVDDDMECGVNDDATECSVCGYVFNSHYWAKTYFNFCPNCGAKMKGGAE